MGVANDVGRPGREGTRWRNAFLLCVVICAAAYAANLLLSEAHPGNGWGLTYGVAATVFMVGALLIGARRRSMRIASRLRLGRSKTWLYFHLYGGTLFMLLVFMHSAFRLPRGLVATSLYWLSLVTFLSGLLGLALQRWIPKVLASGLSTEAHYSRIPELVDEIRERAEALAAKAAMPVRDLFAKQVQPALDRPRRNLRYFIDITGGIRSRLAEFRYLRPLLGREEREQLAELELLYRTKLELDAHYTLQYALRVWLVSHVPVSLLATGLLILHLFSVYYW